MSTDLEIEAAIVWTILHTASPLPIPSALLAADATVGASSVTIGAMQSGSAFAAGSLLLFDDALGERRVRIDHVTGSTVALDYTGMGQTGLAALHPAGTRVYTNLFRGMTIEQSLMLALGDPLLCVAVMTEDEDLVGAPQFYQYAYTVDIRYSLRLAPPDPALAQPSSGIDVNVWALEQQEKAKATLTTIAAALKRNPRLTTDTGTYAIALSSPGQGVYQPDIRHDWTQLVANLDTLEFSAHMVVMVQAAD